MVIGLQGVLFRDAAAFSVSGFNARALRKQIYLACPVVEGVWAGGIVVAGGILASGGALLVVSQKGAQTIGGFTASGSVVSEALPVVAGGLASLLAILVLFPLLNTSTSTAIMDRKSV